MDMTQMVTVFSIVIISYLIGMAAKVSSKVKDEVIPVIVGVAGGVLGAIGMYVIPDFPANDIMNAIAVGIISGLASTGANQALKQFKKL